MITKGKRSTVWLLLLGFTVCLAGAGVVIWNRPTFVPPKLPEPNGYEKLLVASEMLHPKTGSYDELTAEDLAEVVAHNEPALVLVRMGLNEECMVTLVWGGDRTWHDTVHTARIAKNRNIARAFAAAAIHKSRLGNTEAAIQCGLDSIRCGMAVAEGGLVVDWHVGHSNAYQGMATLRALVDSLTKDQAVEQIERFKAVPFEFEDPNSLLERELAYFREIHSSME